MEYFKKWKTKQNKHIDTENWAVVTREEGEIGRGQLHGDGS